jgi:predicted phosphodiesterase
MNKKTKARELAEQYCKEHADMPHLTLAKLLKAKHGLVFKDVEHARDMVRVVRGQKGDRERKNTTDKSLYVEKSPYFTLPKSYAEKRMPLQIKGEKVLLLKDIHFPYHDEEALSTALKWGIDEGCDTLYLNGDILDCHTLSRWEKDPEARSFAQELESVRAFLKLVSTLFKKVYYKEGNHEERYWRYLSSHAPELAEIDAFNLQSLLWLDQYGIEWVDGRTIAKFNSLNVVHGHEFGQNIFSPVNIARGLYTRAKAFAICGHWHQTSQHNEKDINGNNVTTWSVGCLCDLSPRYRPVNQWNHGAAILIKDGKKFRVKNVKIENDEVF